jgi:hypothetical protein
MGTHAEEEVGLAEMLLISAKSAKEEADYEYAVEYALALLATNPNSVEACALLIEIAASLLVSGADQAQSAEQRHRNESARELAREIEKHAAFIAVNAKSLDVGYGLNQSERRAIIRLSRQPGAVGAPARDEIVEGIRRWRDHVQHIKSRKSGSQTRTRTESRSIQYRILSLDDGGSWAPLLQAMALEEVFGGKKLGHDVLKEFQLVAVSGGGAITLAELLLNKSLATIVKDWGSDIVRRKEIFAPRKFWGGYSASKKHDAVRRFLGKTGEHQMAALPGLVQAQGGRSAAFLVCAFDADRKRAEFFRSYLTSRAASDTAAGNNPKLADVIHAATTSPMSPFDGPAVVNDTGFWVAAVAGLYNPVLAAITEALANGEKALDIQVLSIGSGTARLPKRKRRGAKHLTLGENNLASDKDALTRSILHDPADSSTFVAHVALGEDLPPSSQQVVSGSVVRLNPVIRPIGKIELQNWAAPSEFTADEFDQLAKLDKTAVDKRTIDLVRRYGEKWLKDEVNNEPIRVNSRFNCEVGHEKFSRAKKAWWQLTGYTLSAESTSPSPASEPSAAA